MKIPVKNPKVKVIEFKGSLYATIDGSNLWEIDKAAFKIMQMCNGKNSVEDMVNLIQKKTGFPKEDIERVVKEILSELESQGFIKWKEIV